MVGKSMVCWHVLQRERSHGNILLSLMSVELWVRALGVSSEGTQHACGMEDISGIQVILQKVEMSGKDNLHLGVCGEIGQHQWYRWLLFSCLCVHSESCFASDGGDSGQCLIYHMLGVD